MNDNGSQNTIRYIQIEPTNKCNMSCIMCPRKLMTRPTGFMSEKLYRKIVRDASAMGVRTLKLFFMGEPLLHPGIAEMVRYGKACDMNVLLQTNALCLTEELGQNLLEAGLDSLGVSVDGGWAYHKIRGDHYEEVFRNVLKFGILKKQGGFKTSLRLTVLNFGQDEDLLSAFYFPLARFVDSMGYIPLGKHVGTQEMDSEGKLKYVDALPGEKNKDCGDGRDGLIVTWDGKATFCCGDYDCVAPVGNLTEQSVPDIVNSTKLRTTRQKLHSSEFDFEPCKTCVWSREQNAVSNNETGLRESA